MAWVTVAACVAACVPAGLRWLRVAQREHYLAGSATRFAVRWWRSTPADLASATGGRGRGGGVGPAGRSPGWRPPCVVAAARSACPLRGRTSPLAWTRRLRTLAAAWALVEVVVVAIGVVTGLAAPLAVVAVAGRSPGGGPGLLVTAPLERRLSAHFVDGAAARLQRVDPTVVAHHRVVREDVDQGSYRPPGPAAPARWWPPRPASTTGPDWPGPINEHLADGTEVFVAEMGTYGPGEIADLCRWCPPDIAVITAIGPVHLERFGSEDRIVEAKSEIIEPAEDVVLPVDDAAWPRWPTVPQAQGKRVLRCSAVDRSAGVCVVRSGDGSRVSASAHGVGAGRGRRHAHGRPAHQPGLRHRRGPGPEVDPAVIGARLRRPPTGRPPALQAVRSASGVTILDDTYNSNPAGATAALAALAASGRRGRPVRMPTRPGRIGWRW